MTHNSLHEALEAFAFTWYDLAQVCSLKNYRFRQNYLWKILTLLFMEDIITQNLVIKIKAYAIRHLGSCVTLASFFY